jgi:hypothetical protein
VIDLSKPLPAMDTSAYPHAYGGEVAMRERVGKPDIDSYLKPEYAAKAAEPKPSTRPARTLQMPLTVIPPDEPVVASQAPPLMAAADTAQPASSDAQRYAERDAAAKPQKTFRGGDVIVIGAGTLIIVLLIIVLVLLLK